MPVIDTFLRWAGGKTWLIKDYNTIIGERKFEHYFEPFLGGGAIFFASEHNKRAYLSDINEDLINTYIQIRDNPTQVIDALNTMPNTKDDYYLIRDKEYSSDVENAAKFIYLNQTSFNGIYRVNRQGKYNVPYGFRNNWTYDAERIVKASEKLKNTSIKCGDFTINKYIIKENDLVFLDPPYTVSNGENGFIEYNPDVFTLNDQMRLKKYIDYVVNKGAYYILTNAAHENIRGIFNSQNHRMIEVERHSLIGGKNAKRERITEYLFTNIPGGNKT